jgi:hypothetical protein
MRHPFKDAGVMSHQPTTASSTIATKWTPFAAFTDAMNDAVASSENPELPKRMHC